MAKLLEMVRNSPVVKRRVGGYSVVESEEQDPFAQGINFHAHFVGSGEVKSKHDSPEIQEAIDKIWSQSRSGKTQRKVIITVKANSLRVQDVSSKQADDYPIYLVSYCGASAEKDTAFFFIHKKRADKSLRMEVFRLSDASKVSAVTQTLSKAFSIAFKAWSTEKRKREKEQLQKQDNNGSESPMIQRRQLGAAAKPYEVSKLFATEVVNTAGPFTPPATRRVEAIETRVKRSGSFGDSPKDAAAGKPAVRRLRAENEITGSTHDVIMTEDFDEEFQQLAESRANPDLLGTNLPNQADAFNLDDIKKHSDPGPSEDLITLED